MVVSGHKDIRSVQRYTHLNIPEDQDTLCPILMWEAASSAIAKSLTNWKVNPTLSANHSAQ